jgi:hypothetical protein
MIWLRSGRNESVKHAGGFNMLSRLYKINIIISLERKEV